MKFSPSIESTIHDPGSNTLTKLTTLRRIPPQKRTALTRRRSDKFGWLPAWSFPGSHWGSRQGPGARAHVHCAAWYAGSLCEAYHPIQGAFRAGGLPELVVKASLPEREGASHT